MRLSMSGMVKLDYEFQAYRNNIMYEENILYIMRNTIGYISNVMRCEEENLTVYYEV